MPAAACKATKELETLLRERGWEKVRQSKHGIWVFPANGARITIPTTIRDKGRKIKNYTAQIERAERQPAQTGDALVIPTVITDKPTTTEESIRMTSSVKPPASRHIIIDPSRVLGIQNNYGLWLTRRRTDAGLEREDVIRMIAPYRWSKTYMKKLETSTASITQGELNSLLKLYKATMPSDVTFSIVGEDDTTYAEFRKPLGDTEAPTSAPTHEIKSIAVESATPAVVQDVAITSVTVDPQGIASRMAPNTPVRAFLRSYRRAWGIPQGEIARKLGFSPGHFCKMENGKAAISPDIQELWLKALGLTSADLPVPVASPTPEPTAPLKEVSMPHPRTVENLDKALAEGILIPHDLTKTEWESVVAFRAQRREVPSVEVTSNPIVGLSEPLPPVVEAVVEEAAITLQECAALAQDCDTVLSVAPTQDSLPAPLTAREIMIAELATILGSSRITDEEARAIFNTAKAEALRIISTF